MAGESPDGRLPDGRLPEEILPFIEALRRISQREWMNFHAFIHTTILKMYGHSPGPGFHADDLAQETCKEFMKPYTLANFRGKAAADPAEPEDPHQPPSSAGSLALITLTDIDDANIEDVGDDDDTDDDDTDDDEEEEEEEDAANPALATGTREHAQITPRQRFEVYAKTVIKRVRRRMIRKANRHGGQPPQGPPRDDPKDGPKDGPNAGPSAGPGNIILAPDATWRPQLSNDVELELLQDPDPPAIDQIIARERLDLILARIEEIKQSDNPWEARKIYALLRSVEMKETYKQIADALDITHEQVRDRLLNALRSELRGLLARYDAETPPPASPPASPSSGRARRPKKQTIRRQQSAHSQPLSSQQHDAPQAVERELQDMQDMQDDTRTEEAQ